MNKFKDYFNKETIKNPEILLNYSEKPYIAPPFDILNNPTYARP